MSEASLAGNPSSSLAMMNALSATGTAGKANNANELAEMLMQQFGQANVQQSVNNIAAQMIGELVMQLIDSLPMPDFMADAAREAVSGVMSDASGETPDGLDSQVSEMLGQNASSSDAPASSGGAASTGGSEAGSDVESDLGAIMKQSLLDETESASEGSGGSGGNQNWLVVLARAMGSTAGKHLKSMIELGEKMGGIDSKESPEEFAKIQSEFQAASQIFKMLLRH